MLLLLLSSSLLLLEAFESSESEDIVIDCAFRLRGFEVDVAFDEAFVFDDDGFEAGVFVFEVEFDAEAVVVEDDLREVVLDVVLFVVVELLVPSDWRRGGLKGKRLRFACAASILLTNLLSIRGILMLISNEAGLNGCLDRSPKRVTRVTLNQASSIKPVWVSVFNGFLELPQLRQNRGCNFD